MICSTGLCTTDLSDRFADQLQYAAPIFHDYGGKPTFSGEIVTVEAPEDNSFVRSTLEKPGLGRVLVVDGHASQKCALLGDQLALLAVKNGWAGVVVHGYVRDSERLEEMDLGIRALGTFPRKSEKQGRGSVGGELRFAGLELRPGMWLYADGDGIVVSARPLSL